MQRFIAQKKIVMLTDNGKKVDSNPALFLLFQEEWSAVSRKKYAPEEF